MSGYLCLCVQATATHRKTCTERYMFLGGKKSLCALLLIWTNTEAVWGSVGKRGLQDCLLSSTWDGDAGSWSQEMVEKRRKQTGRGRNDVAPESNPNWAKAALWEIFMSGKEHQFHAHTPPPTIWVQVVEWWLNMFWIAKWLHWAMVYLTHTAFGALSQSKPLPWTWSAAELYAEYYMLFPSRRINMGKLIGTVLNTPLL